MEKIILIGAGGHCKSVLDLLSGQYSVWGITDSDTKKHGNLFYGIKVLGDDSELKRIFSSGVTNALVTVGSVGNPEIREKLYKYAVNLGFQMINVFSKNALISPSVKIGKGNTFMDRVIIHADSKVGDNNIFNTSCVVEHDCIIGDNVHIAPGALISGGVTIGNGSHVGVGASVIQGIKIGSNCVIGAGAAVIKDIPDNSLCVGVPARIIGQISREVSNEG